MVLEYETPFSKGMIFDAVKIKIFNHEDKDKRPKIIIERADKSTANLVYNTIEQRDEWYEKLKNQVYAQTYLDKIKPDKKLTLEILKDSINER